MSDLIDRQAAISAICNACGKIDCDKMDKCEKLQLPPANCSEFPNNSDTISRQAAIDAVKHAWAKGIEPSQYIESIEPADVAPVVHARWENYSPITIKCSRCGYVIHDWRYSECKYCPKCGAKMDGGKNT